MAKADRLNVAVAGLGWWGKVIIKTLGQCDKLRVAKTVDVDPAAGEWARAQGLIFENDFDAAVDDPGIDAVILCTPHSTHTRQVIRVAGAKKHVFCEKPLALTCEDARTSVDACRSNGVVLGVGHELRFTPPMIELLRMAKAGELGSLVQCEGSFTGIVKHAAGNWRISESEAPGGPPMTGRGIHTLDLCIGVLGPADRVLASLRRMTPGAINGDTLGILLNFKSGANALITALWSSPFTNRFTVFGTQGWAEVRDKAHPEKAAGWTLTRCSHEGEITSIEYPAMSPVLANLEAFADAVAGRAAYPITPAEMAATVAALEAIGQSAITDQIAQVPPVAAH